MLQRVRCEFKRNESLIGVGFDLETGAVSTRSRFSRVDLRFKQKFEAFRGLPYESRERRLPGI